MDARLAALIADYQSKVSDAVELLERGLGITRPASTLDWAESDIPQSGSLPGPAAYFKHGYGCAILWLDALVDFDFGTHGAIDGFDAMRLAVFMETNRLEYGLSSHEEIQDLMAVATEAGEIVCATGFGLSYLALDAQKTRQAVQGASGAARVKPGPVHEEERRVAPNVGAVASWYRSVAEQGFPEAQYIVGTYCRESEDFIERNVEAPNWFRRAAEQGHALALYETGRESGNLEEAVQWHRQAADQGVVEAQYALGVCYRHGYGDYREAAYWYSRAADQGLVEAQCALGNMYSKGCGVPQDYALATEWLRKAAMQGAEYAQYDLVDLLESGLVPLQKPGEPKRWSYAPDAAWQLCPHCRVRVLPSLDGLCCICETQIAPADARTPKQPEKVEKRMRSDVPCLFVALAGLTLLLAAVIASMFP